MTVVVTAPLAVYDASDNFLGLRATPATVYNAITALTATQKANIWTDFTSGTPPRWAADQGPNAGAIGIGFGIVQNLAASLTAAQLTDMKIRAVTAFVLDNPQYLVQPSFDATINVPGFNATGA